MSAPAHTNEVAPAGQRFICSACGKMSRDLDGTQRISGGWDESCMLHAVLCFDERTPDGHYRAVPGGRGAA